MWLLLPPTSLLTYVEEASSSSLLQIFLVLQNIQVNDLYEENIHCGAADVFTGCATSFGYEFFNPPKTGETESE